MIRFNGRVLLLDIEGTVSKLSFVHEVLFPYARERVGGFLAEHGSDAPVKAALEQMARDDGAASFAEWCPEAASGRGAAEWVTRKVHAWMDVDAKLTGLKQLQGMVWEGGFRDGVLKSHLFEDVPPGLEACAGKGISNRIYSSGSAAAQKLFFRYSEFGDLSRWIDGFYDTTFGPKRSTDSYRAIAAESRVAAREILFLSDVPEELDAASAAGCQVGLMLRPGNRPVSGTTYPEIRSLAELELR